MHALIWSGVKTLTHRLQPAVRIQSCDWNWFDLYSYPYSTWSNLNWRCRADLDLVFSKSHLSDFVRSELVSDIGLFGIQDEGSSWPSMTPVWCLNPAREWMKHWCWMQSRWEAQSDGWRHLERGKQMHKGGQADRERWVKKRRIDLTSRTLIYTCCTLFHL